MEIFLGIFIALILVILTYFKVAFSYWKNRNLPYLKPRIPFGTWDNPFRRTVTPGIHIKSLHDRLKKQGLKHGGTFIFTSPRYMPTDPELIKNILQKDFNYFMDRGLYYNEKDDPLSATLFSIEGQRWKRIRAKLTPTFTSGKMKLMFDTLIQCGYQMQGAMNNYCENKQSVDIKNILACFTTDVIVSCAFGIECNSFKNPDAEFRRYGKALFNSMSKLQALRFTFCMAAPNLARKLKIKIIPQECAKFFLNAVKDTVKYRESNGIVRKDMLQLLIDLKNNSSDGESFTIEEMAAQAFVFFFAGFETSSTAMTFCLYELTQNKDIQQMIRDEINEVLEKHEGKITYDGIMEMKYLNQVVEETLRKYPPVSFLNRKCVKDYNIPGTNIILEKGVAVSISILGLHHDPDYYPDPEKFDPERFSEKNKQKRQSFTYMPFGEGPRICIGLRFGMMQTKVGLAILLQNFKFSLNEKTEVPLKLDPFSFVLTSKSGIYLNLEKV